MIRCISCHQPYPKDATPYCCPNCGEIYDFDDLPEFNLINVDDRPGIWRYRHIFGLPKDSPEVYLGEGDTPLVWANMLGKKVGFKLEYLNPTHSFKDRGTAVLVSHLLSRNVQEAIEDSSGNAGSSFAAYASRVGINAKIFVPDYASGPKRDQIAAYGADIISIKGSRTHTAEAVRQAADQGAVYASHAYLPHGNPGFATVAFELWEQIGSAPGTVITPAGQGNLLLGISRGFSMMHHTGLIKHLPTMVGVQAMACAPLWTKLNNPESDLNEITEGETLAEGVRASRPHRIKALIKMMRSTQGKFVAVKEGDILRGRDHLSRLGFFVEPTSAIVWSALEQVVDRVPEPIVVILTGSGLKATC